MKINKILLGFCVLIFVFGVHGGAPTNSSGSGSGVGAPQDPGVSGYGVLPYGDTLSTVINKLIRDAAIIGSAILVFSMLVCGIAWIFCFRMRLYRTDDINKQAMIELKQQGEPGGPSGPKNYNPPTVPPAKQSAHNEIMGARGGHQHPNQGASPHGHNNRPTPSPRPPQHSQGPPQGQQSYGYSSSSSRPPYAGGPPQGGSRPPYAGGPPAGSNQRYEAM